MQPLVSLNSFRAMLFFMLILVLVVQPQVAQPMQGQSCSTELGNLNVCAPFVLPGVSHTNPSSDCCGALQAVDHDCLCNTLRIAARLPSLCNIPPLTCGN